MVQNGKKVINLTAINVTGSSNSDGNHQYQNAVRRSRRSQHERQLAEYRLRRGPNNAGASHWDDAPPRAGPSRQSRVPDRTTIRDLPPEVQAGILDRLNTQQNQLRFIALMDPAARQLHWPVVYANRLKYLLHITHRGHTFEIYVPEPIEVTPSVTRYRPPHRIVQQETTVEPVKVKCLTSGHTERPGNAAELHALLEALCVAHKDFMMIIRAKPNGRGVIWQGHIHQLAKYRFDQARLDRFLQAAPRDDGHYVPQWWGHDYDYINDAWNILDLNISSSNTNSDSDYRPPKVRNRSADSPEP